MKLFKLLSNDTRRTKSTQTWRINGWDKTADWNQVWKLWIISCPALGGSILEVEAALRYGIPGISKAGVNIKHVGVKTEQSVLYHDPTRIIYLTRISLDRMASEYARGALRVCVAQLCQNLGWNAIQSTPLELLTDILERYLLELGKTTGRYCEQFGRLDPNLDDLGLAFRFLGIPLGELEEYVRHLDPVPFAHDVVTFPAPKDNNLQFPNPKSREIQQEREEHIPDYLPYMYPGMEDEVGASCTPQQTPEAPQTATPDDRGTPIEASPVAGEKRPASSPGDGLPSKRMRLSSSNLPEEAGHSQYEMMSVTMSQTGHLTPTRGQGKLPDASTPPPGLRQHIVVGGDSERRRKDSDRERFKMKERFKFKAKNRDSYDAPVISGVPREKENSSESFKPRLHHFIIKGSKKDPGKHITAIKGKHLKFGKPLFKSKISKSKKFAHSSAIQDMLFSEPLNISDSKSNTAKEKSKVSKVVSESMKRPELERLMTQETPKPSAKGAAAVESDKEKPEVSRPKWDNPLIETSDDSEDDLSGGDSPTQRLVIAEVSQKPRDTEVRKKERLQRIDDILDSVIRSSVVDSEDSSSLVEMGNTPQHSTPTSTPVKTKIKDKDKSKVKSTPKNTSSIDLDDCINNVVKQSSSEESKPVSETGGDKVQKQSKETESPIPSEKKVKVKKKLKNKDGKSKSKGSGKVRDKLKDKVKPRSASQESSGLDSETPSAKPEKVYPPQFGVFDFQADSPETTPPLAPLRPPVSTPPASTPTQTAPAKKPSPTEAPEKPVEALPSGEKADNPDDKPQTSTPTEVQPLKLDLTKDKSKHKDKERSKEREHKKDRKDKKKDKEKKKKNKDRDREKSKDRDRKDKHRDKHGDDKGDGVPPLTIPKLKLKIGGISVGGTSSKAITIAAKTPPPKEETPSPDEIKAAPIRAEIPKLVIKPVPRRPVMDSPIKSPTSPSLSNKPLPQPRAAPPPGFKAIPESVPVGRTDTTVSSPKSQIPASPERNKPHVQKEDVPKSSPSKTLPTPTPPMLPKFRPIPPVSSSPPPVRNIISPPSPPKPPPSPPKPKLSPPKPKPSPPKPPLSPPVVKSPPPAKKASPVSKPVPPPPKPSPPRSPSPSPSPSPPPKRKSPTPPPTPPPPAKEEVKPKSPEKANSPPPSPKPNPPIFYPAPPRRTASLSPRSREIPLYSTPPPKRKTGSPRGRKPSSPARSATTPPKKRGPKTSPGGKKGSPRGPKKKALAAAAKGDLSSPPPSTFTREEEHPSFSGAKSTPKSSVTSASVSKEASPSPSESPAPSPVPSPPSSPVSSKSELPPPPPPSKPQPLQRAVFAETVGTSADDTGQRIWICPSCKMPDDGSPMIGCDKCDEWYHWPCVSIVEPPPEDEDWYCPKCKVAQTKTKGRGKGAKRGRKKKRT